MRDLRPIPVPLVVSYGTGGLVWSAAGYECHQAGDLFNVIAASTRLDTGVT